MNRTWIATTVAGIALAIAACSKDEDGEEADAAAKTAGPASDSASVSARVAARRRIAEIWLEGMNVAKGGRSEEAQKKLQALRSEIEGLMAGELGLPAGGDLDELPGGDGDAALRYLLDVLQEFEPKAAAEFEREQKGATGARDEGRLEEEAREAEESAEGGLREIAAATDRFKWEDTDGNGVNDFWVGDVSALYRLVAPKVRVPAELVAYEIAAADAAPLPEGDFPGGGRIGRALSPAPVPRSGYLFAIVPEYEREEGSRERFDRAGNSRNPGEGEFHFEHYAFCAFPARYRDGWRKTFLLDGTGKIWSRDLGGKSVRVVPRDPAAAGWEEKGFR